MGGVTDGGQAGTGQAGTRIAGRYRLIDTVGQGGMGVVWRAQDEVLGRTVAVKQVHIPSHLPEQEQQVLRERVLREARAAARLHDPAAVTVFDVVLEGGSPYLVMELVDAASLAERVRDEGPVPAREAARIGLAVLGALEAAHKAGIIHRDVKPGNVMVCANGRVLLTDFGIASTQGDASITQTGLLLGSPAYIAPERARGGSGGPESDLWALGGTLFTAVEGVPPFEGEGALQTLTAVVEGRRRPTRRAGPLAPVIDALLAADPASRPTAAEARRMLDQVVRGGTPAGPPTAATTVLPASRPATGLDAREMTAVLPPDPLGGRYAGGGGQGTGSYQPGYDEPGRDPHVGRRRTAIVLVALALVAAVTLGGLALAGVFTKARSGIGGNAPLPTGWTTAPGPGKSSIGIPPDWRSLAPPTVPSGTGTFYGTSGSQYVRITADRKQSALATLQEMEQQKHRARGRPIVVLPADDPSATPGGPPTDIVVPSDFPTDGGTSGAASTDASPSSTPAATTGVATTAPVQPSTRPSAAPSTERVTPSASPPAATSTATSSSPSPSATASTTAAAAPYALIRLEGAQGMDPARSAYWEYTETDGGTNLHLLEYALVSGNTLYTVLFVSKAEDFAGLTASGGTFSRMHDTFKTG
jgi:tRNA A-37 threonylcarbamoyl transferase component Bud32